MVIKINKKNKIYVIAVIAVIALLFLVNQGWINLHILHDQTFVIHKGVFTEDGELYYGCKAPISMQDCIYYGTEYYNEDYANLKNTGCRIKDWGIECTFTGEPVL